MTHGFVMTLSLHVGRSVTSPADTSSGLGLTVSRSPSSRPAAPGMNAATRIKNRVGSTLDNWSFLTMTITANTANRVTKQIYGVTKQTLGEFLGITYSVE